MIIPFNLTQAPSIIFSFLGIVALFQCLNLETERSNNIFLLRFRCLHDSGGVLQLHHSKVCKVVIACIVLHNIAVKANIPYDDIDPQDEDDLEVGIELRNNTTGLQVRHQVIQRYFM